MEKTLGAYRTHKVSTSPNEETFYWLPCFTRVADTRTERGKLIPHCLFIVSNLDNHVLCPDCRERRTSGYRARDPGTYAGPSDLGGETVF